MPFVNLVNSLAVSCHFHHCEIADFPIISNIMGVFILILQIFIFAELSTLGSLKFLNQGTTAHEIPPNQAENILL